MKHDEETKDQAPDDEAMTSTPGNKLSADVVCKRTETLPENQREIIRWFFAHLRFEQLSMKQAGALIGVDGGTVNKVLWNKYPAAIDGICQAMERYRDSYQERARIEEERQSVVGGGFVETSTAKKIWQVCEWATISQSIAFIWSDSHIGKTEALRQYARRHRETVRMFRMPACGGVQLSLKEIARACLVTVCDVPFEKLREKVLGAVDHNTLLVADEIHLVFSTYNGAKRIAVLELLREIYDRTNCGMVMCGTTAFRRELQAGKHKEMLQQLDRRGVVKMRLPAVPIWRDVMAIAESYGLTADVPTEAKQLATDICKASGLGKYTRFLKSAARLAANRREPIAWQHFVSAHDIIARLGLEDEKEEQ